MGYELIIAEKPTAAEKIAYALADDKVTKKALGKVTYFELTRRGQKIIVASTVGHLFGLAEQEKKGWTYPIFALTWKPNYEISKGAAWTKKYFYTLKKIAGEADSFVNGCDLDTEGELIFKNILQFICREKGARRMRFSTLTRGDLISSYEDASPHLDFRMASAGETRHYLDWLWGVNSSRALTLAIKQTGKGFKILSSGRVQSPTLALLAEREKEIEKFVPKPFWQLLATILIKKKEITASHKKEKFWKEKEAKKILSACSGKKAVVAKIDRKSRRIAPPVPFNLSSLQTEAYNQFGFSPSFTLQIAESLYLAAYISYPRTASEKLPAKIQWRAILAALAKIKDFGPAALALLAKKKLKPQEGKKTDPAHVAIYPTSSPPKNLNELSEQQRKIYYLIVRRFFAVFGPPAIREILKINFDIAGEIFTTSGARTLNPGWTSFYPYAKFKEVTLPALKEGEIFDVKALELKKDQTKPPSRYTQGSIIVEMEKRGLGTKATRAEILKTLYDRNYIVGKSVQVTELGKNIVKILGTYVPDLISAQLTKHFEAETEQIQAGEKEEEDVLAEAKSILTKVFTKFKKREKEIGHKLLQATRETRRAATVVGKCPTCGGELRIIRSKASGKIFVGCSNYSKGCRTSYPLPQGRVVKTSKQICSTCGSPIVYVFTKGKRPWRLCINHACESKKQNQQQEKNKKD